MAAPLPHEPARYRFSVHSLWAPVEEPGEIARHICAHPLGPSERCWVELQNGQTVTVRPLDPTLKRARAS